MSDIEKIDELYEMVKENNKILRSMRSSMRWSAIFKTLYWVVIIGIAVGGYYFIQPYVQSVVNAYNGISADIKTVANVSNTTGKVTAPVTNIVKKYFNN